MLGKRVMAMVCSIVIQCSMCVVWGCVQWCVVIVVVVAVVCRCVCVHRSQQQFFRNSSLV